MNTLQPSHTSSVYSCRLDYQKNNDKKEFKSTYFSDRKYRKTLLPILNFKNPTEL